MPGGIREEIEQADQPSVRVFLIRGTARDELVIEVPPMLTAVTLVVGGHAVLTGHTVNHTDGDFAVRVAYPTLSQRSRECSITRQGATCCYGPNWSSAPGAPGRVGLSADRTHAPRVRDAARRATADSGLRRGAEAGRRPARFAHRYELHGVPALR
jgi:hypothetical protein